MIRAILPERGQDAFGSGAYGASRGSRSHNGVDFQVPVGSKVLAPVSGTVTKLGFPYKQEPTSPFKDEGEERKFYAKAKMRYVEIEADGMFWRVMYIEPRTKVGYQVRRDDTIIGIAQDLQTAYGSGMTRHVHLEIFEMIGKEKVYYNPLTLRL